jgi:hypothetical protein
MRLPGTTLALAVVLILAGCKSDPPAAPAGSDCLDPAAAVDGFFLSGMGYNSAKVDQNDGQLGLTVFQSSFRPGGAGSVVMSGGAAIGGTDTSIIQTEVRIPAAGTGTYAWGDLTSSDGTSGMTLRISAGKAAGYYRSMSGTTVVTAFGTELAGKFCGSLKDSLGHIITLSGGRFASH